MIARAINQYAGRKLTQLNDLLNRPKVKPLFLGFLLALVLFNVAGHFLKPWYELVPNLSNSLPGYLYVLDKTRAPECGDATAFTMPVDERFYRGSRMIKIIRGCAGDSISVDTNRRVFINNDFVGAAMPTSSNGQYSLHPISEMTIPANRVYLYASHPQSYDSRYSSFGVRSKDELEGTMYRIF